MKPSRNYIWTTEEPQEGGFYIALKVGTLNPVLVCVLARDYEECKIGAHSYIGENDNCNCGKPSIIPMHEEFIMWSRLPDPLDK